jgi:hypothetical protein
MRIAALVIYQAVTSSGRNISRLDGPGLCSKVLGTLNGPSPLTALSVHPEQRVTSCGDAAVVTDEELCRWVNCQPAEGSLLVAGDCCVSRRPNIAIRQQFHFALLEDCSFFAHLVLRCVRGEDGSLYGVAAPNGAKPRPASEVQRAARSIIRSCVQQELQNRSAGALGASLSELETLWTEVASRSVRISACEGGRL